MMKRLYTLPIYLNLYPVWVIVFFVVFVRGALAISSDAEHLKGDEEEAVKPYIVGQSPANESTLVTLPDGTHKIFFINRPGNADRMMSLHSSDGIKWSDPMVEFELPGEAYYANRVVVSKSGTIHCVFHVWSTGDLGYRGRQLDLWYTSQKTGDQWAKPKKIFEGYVGSIRSFMELTNERLILSFGKAVPERVSKPAAGYVDYGWNEVVSLYSDDDGENWGNSNALSIEIDSDKTTRYGAVEPDVIELESGRLWMLIRTNKGVLYESFSLDGGSSWSDPEPSMFISSDSPPAFLRLRDGRLVLFFNMNQRWDDPNSYAFGGREALHAAISADDGKSWKGFREVFNVYGRNSLGEVKGDRGTAYPSATETEDGRIILVTGQGESRSILILDPDYLEETSEIELQVSTSNTVDLPAQLFHFGARRSGIVHMTLDVPEAVSSIRIELTDHYTIPTDTAVNKNPVCLGHLPISNNPGLLELSIEWNMDRGKAKIRLPNNRTHTYNIKRDSVTGINYLRLLVLDDLEEPMEVPSGELVKNYYITNI